MTTKPDTISARSAFSGIWPALLTPLNADLSIDHARLAAHCKSLLARGCQGVTVFGTTGEGPSFSMAERKQALEQLITNGIAATQIMVSTSCAALPETLALTRHAVKAGVHGCLMLPPFFFKGVSDQGVIDSYRYVIDGMGSEQQKLKLYLYHIPQVTGVGLSPAVITSLQKRYPDTIMGIKDSACSTEHSIGLAQAFMQDLTVYVGFEPDLPEMSRRGSTGAISGLANFMPQLVARLISQPDAATTAAERERVVALIGLLGAYSLMPALKGIMALLTGQADWLRVRAPLVALTPTEYTELEKTMRDFALQPDTE